jgi:hypothetical protein
MDREHWRDLSPVRLPDTIAVREKLPPGAAAVLINRGHTYTDLVLPIGPREAELLARVDGRRTIGEIAARSARQVGVRAFFQQLWRYDQIVFDASKSGVHH